MHRASPGALVGALALLPASAALAACPVGQIVTVDNDKAGSGYSEDNPKDWAEHNVDACSGTYRYLTRGSAPTQPPGKAFWKPAIQIAGLYEVETGFRASSNRSDDADYELAGDLGDSAKLVVDQTLPEPQSACKKATIGKVRCLPGGKCQLTLIAKGGESVASDITTFKLVECIDVAPPDQPPTGALDQADCNGLSGWAWDPDEPGSAIAAHLYIGGPAGSGATGLPLVANVSRPDLCTAIGSCAHGFLAPFPDTLRDGLPRAVHAYGVNEKTGTSAELPGSPKTAQCAPAPVDPQPNGGAAGTSPGGASSAGSSGAPAAGNGGALGGSSAAGVGGAGASGNGGGSPDATGRGGSVTGSRAGAGGLSGAAGDRGVGERSRGSAAEPPASSESGCAASDKSPPGAALLGVLGALALAMRAARRTRR